MRRCICVALALMASPAHACDVQEIADISAETTLPLGRNTYAQVRETGETLRVRIVTDGRIVSSRNFDTYLLEDRVGTRIYLTDLNRDGLREMFIGMGHGMVNNDYRLMNRNAQGAWQSIEGFSDPAFCVGGPDFTTAARSGPRWFQTLWTIAPDGLPRARVEQAMIDSRFERRQERDATGAVVNTTIVEMGTDIHAPTGPLTAQIADDTRLEVATGQVQLSAGTLVTLHDSDDTFSRLLIRTSDGQTGWVSVGDVTAIPP